MKIYGIYINSMAPDWCANNFKSVIYKHMLLIKFMSTFHEIALMWLPQNTFDDKSTLVQVMAWYHQAPWTFAMKYLSESPYKKSTLVHIMAWCRQQRLIIWAKADPDIRRHMVSPGHDVLYSYTIYLTVILLFDKHQQ